MIMAEKKTETKKVLERTYNVPLRKGFQKAPKYRRAKKAINVLREFLSKHMKSDNIKIGKFLNLEIWKRGIKNPPHHVKINAIKDSEGIVNAELVGAPVIEKKEEPKKKDKIKPEKDIEKALEDLEGKTEKIKKESVVKAKVEEKIEIDALKQHPPEPPKADKMPPKEMKKQESVADTKTVKKPHGSQTLEKHQVHSKKE